ncbi:RICIN domain-containing protein [Streptomyces sp. NPDC058683]|uniref:RCC1 domain-containing protein n=1 Tax=Streptomyces sp. NPDC058683 TaxID=3346597 RepID=UPI00364BA4C5
MTTMPVKKRLPKTPVRIVSALSGLALDVTNGSRDDLAAIIQSADPDCRHQHWRIEPLGSDQYRIVNENSGSVLDGGSKDDGTPVIQYGWHGGANQRWRIVPVTDGQYRIDNINSDRPMDVSKSSKKDGAPVLQRDWKGGENQQWRIVPVEQPVRTGTVLTWGANGSSQLGTGPGADRSTPSQVKLNQCAPLDRVKALARSNFHTLAVLEDGTVRAWGNNDRGALGDGSTSTRNTPVAVLAQPRGERLSEVKSVATGSYNQWGHSMALLENGTVLAWGYGGYGQLGNGGNGNQYTPVAVKADKDTVLSGVQAIAGAMVEYSDWDGMFSLALLEDGTVRAWGYNAHGQLGDGAKDVQHMPVTVLVGKGQPLMEVKAIAAGAHHALALLKDGTVRAWGCNEQGQLGIGSTSAKNMATLVTANDNGDPLTGVKAIAAGGRFSLALLEDGTVRAWGRNDRGQLGNGTGTDQKRPVTVRWTKDGDPLTGVTAIAAGARHSLALMKDQTMRAWGYNGHGELGDGGNTDQWTPALVLLALDGEPLSGVTAIAAGAYHSMAIRGAAVAVTPGGPPDVMLTPAGEIGYPGVRLDAEGTVYQQTVRVSLPEGKGLEFVAEGNPGYLLTIQDAGGATTSYAGNLSPDGQTLTFTNVDLALPGKGSTSRAWIPVRALPTAPLGDTSLSFTVGDQTSPSTPMHIVETV